MRQQNADMAGTTVIPIFGYTPEARKQQIRLDNEETTVELALATTKDIIRIEATPSTWNLHKYLVIVQKENKEKVAKEIKKIFSKISGTLENQPKNFPTPRCGGSEKFDANPTSPPMKDMDNTTEVDKTTTAYMVSLETLAMANNPQDAGPTAPPKRHRKFTFSYASAAKSGLVSRQQLQLESTSSDADRKTITPDGNSQDSLTSTSNQNQVKDLDSELKEVKASLESRMNKQEEQMSELIQVAKRMNEDIEKRMAHAVLQVLVKEREQIQEITHGRVYHASEAPLADENGNLPYGGKVQLGGPLDRLHHVEVTVQQMANALDTILKHIQKDPMAKHLFKDSESETSTIIENQEREHPNTVAPSKSNINITDSDAHMTQRDFSGSKRQLTHDSPEKNKFGREPITISSPQRSPPPKKERSSESMNPSANPDDDWERGKN
jgi:hypothetical protein